MESIPTFGGKVINFAMSDCTILELSIGKKHKRQTSACLMIQTLTLVVAKLSYHHPNYHRPWKSPFFERTHGRVYVRGVQETPRPLFILIFPPKPPPQHFLMTWAPIGLINPIATCQSCRCSHLQNQIPYDEELLEAMPPLCRVAIEVNWSKANQ